MLSIVIAVIVAVAVIVVVITTWYASHWQQQRLDSAVALSE